jgi:hypothetical protein
MGTVLYKVYFLFHLVEVVNLDLVRFERGVVGLDTLRCFAGPAVAVRLCRCVGVHEHVMRWQPVENKLLY